MDKFSFITDPKRLDDGTIKSAVTKMGKHPSITDPKRLDDGTIKSAFTKMGKHHAITDFKRRDGKTIRGALTKLDEHPFITGPKRLDVKRIKSERKIDEKKFHKKRWKENVLSQFSLGGQIITCFTDDSFFDKVLSGKSFHLGIKSKCVGKKESGTTILDRKQTVDEDFAKPVAVKCLKAKSTSILASSTHLPSSEIVVSEEVDSKRILLPSCQRLFVVETRMTDLEDPDPEGCSVIQSNDKVSGDRADSHFVSSAVAEPLRRSGFDCAVFDPPPGFYKSSDHFSSVEVQKVSENAVGFNGIQKELPKSIQICDGSVMQRYVIETSSKNGPEVIDPTSLSPTIDTGYVSNSTMKEKLNSVLRVVNPENRSNLDVFQSSQCFLADSIRAEQKTGVIREVETCARISIETFHFELDNFAAVSIDNVPLSGNSLENGKPLEEQTYPSDWQVISNEEFTTLPVITQNSVDQDRNLLPEPCLKNADSFSAAGANDDREYHSTDHLSTSIETTSHHSLHRYDDTQNVNIIKKRMGSFGFRRMLKPKHVCRTSKNIDAPSMSENIPGQYYGYGFKSTKSTQQLKYDVAVNSSQQQIGRIKAVRCEGNFVPIKSNCVRFVSEMKVVLERNATADQMAIRDSSRRSKKAYQNRINVKNLLDCGTSSCLRCDVMFTTFQDLIHHIDGHKAENLHLCYYCQAQLISNSHRIRHMRSHTGEKPYPCPICNKSFSRLENMKTHRNIHNKVKKFSDIWGKNHDRNNKIRCHPPDPFGDKFDRSEICGKSSTGNNLDIHAMVHSDFLRCERNFSRRGLSDDSERHTQNRSHLDEKPQHLNKKQFPNATKFCSQCDDLSFICDCCPKTFSSSRGLKIHWRLVHGRISQHRSVSVGTK